MNIANINNKSVKLAIAKFAKLNILFRHTQILFQQTKMSKILVQSDNCK